MRHLARVGRRSGHARSGEYPWRALSPHDVRKNRTRPSVDEERRQAREVLEPVGMSTRPGALRGRLQSSALSKFVGTTRMVVCEGSNLRIERCRGVGSEPSGRRRRRQLPCTSTPTPRCSAISRRRSDGSLRLPRNASRRDDVCQLIVSRQIGGITHRHPPPANTTREPSR